MKYVFWMIKIALFVALLVFALANQQNATVNLIIREAVTLPMVVVILGSFVLGLLAGILVVMPRWWKWRRKAKSAHKQLQAVQPPAEATASSVAELERTVPPSNTPH